ncbi:porin [Sulfitobacter sp. LCG007]
MRFSPFLTIALALAGTSALSQSTEFTSVSGATATFYGQINLTYQGVDDGDDTYGDIVDNSNSGSRVGLWIRRSYGDRELSFNFETNLGLKNTADTSQNDDVDALDWQRTDIRKLEVVYGGSFGKLWLGQGSMATDGAAEVDNSGTSIAGYVNVSDSAGGYTFQNAGVLSGTRIGDAFKDFDGGRRMRVRYDSPEMAGLILSAAYGEEVLNEDDDSTYYDVALRYLHDGDVIGISSAIGYSWTDGDDGTDENLVASGTLLHKATGLNVTLAAGDKRSGDGRYVFTKLGWITDLVSVGQTAFAVDYYNGQDFAVAGSDSDSWGIEAVQQFEKQGLEAYVGYRVYAFDDNAGSDYEDIRSLLLGARWKF